jgi:hypothetical protein
LYVRLSNGDGTFSDPGVNLVRPETPLLADLNGDGAPDVSIVDAAGNILFRNGRPGEPGSFAPPITVNPGNPSRDIAFLVVTSLGPVLASVDANDNAISFYKSTSAGFVKVFSLATGSEPAQILAADLNNDGRSDLIVRNAGDGTISVFLGDPAGYFLSRIDLPVGKGVSDIQVADFRGNGQLDIVFTNRLFGQVGVLEYLGGRSFSSPTFYRAGAGPYGVTGTSDPSLVSSREATTSLAVGTFTAGGLPSLVALNPGSNTFSVLAGLSGDRFSNPADFPTSTSGLVVRAIDFGGDGVDGLVVLGPAGLFVYRSDGQGGFLPPTELNVGFEPNGLTVDDLNGDGKPDLLVGNPLGDVLVLVGNGDGTFQPVHPLDQQVSMAVYGPSGSTPSAFIFADQLTNQLVVQFVGGATTVLGDTSTGLISPGAVKLADLNNDGILDLVVANTGSNNVLVYPGQAGGTFGAALNDGHGFFTGTNPTGITVADVNGDGRPDLIIANRGSNDVSILINVKEGNSFSFVPGPRLKVGDGPVSTVVTSVAGGVPSLLVTDSGSNDVRLLPGIGNGFFDDRSPTIYSVGTNPGALFVGNFGGGSGQDLVTVNSGSDNVTLISGFGTASPVIQTVSTGGSDPIAAFAVDLHGDGVNSLVVANSGDGIISLLSPGENGLSLNSVVSSPGLPNPSALAFADVSSSDMEFYATTEGHAAATLLGFDFGEAGGGGGSFSPGTSATPGGSAQLLTLNETSLALVGTLLTVTLELQTESEQTSEGPAALVASSGPGGAGQSIVGQFGQSAVSDPLGESSSEAPADAPNPLSWARFVTGVDQAIETLRREADQRLKEEQQPNHADHPGTSLLEEGAKARPTELPTLNDPTVSGVSRTAGPQADRWDTIDAAISSLEPGNRAAEGFLDSITSVAAHPDSPAPVRPVVELKDRARLVPRANDVSYKGVETHVTRAAALLAIAATATKVRARRSKRSLPLRLEGASPASRNRIWRG